MNETEGRTKMRREGTFNVEQENGVGKRREHQEEGSEESRRMDREKKR